MGFADAVKVCFRNYFTFSGRASRPEYWWFFLFVILGGFVTGLVDGMLFGGVFQRGPHGFRAESSGPLNAVFSLVTLVPLLAAGWRRMHDSGRSGLYLLYPLIVLVGIGTFASFVGGFQGAGPGGAAEMFTGVAGIVLGIAMIVLMISPLLVIWWLTRPSEPGPNEYGPTPTR